MSDSGRTPRFELLAGLLTWAAVSGLTVWVIVQPRSGVNVYSGTLEPFLALALLNLAAMLVTGRPGWALATRRGAHALMGFSAFAMGWLLPLDWLQIFTIIWIAMAPSLYSQRFAFIAMLVVLAIWYAIARFHWYEPNPLIGILLFAAFHLFALLTARTAHVAEARRDRMQQLYGELIATQHLLSEASRQSERTRIARDLHDLVGHHLTALSINLQIAERLTDGEAKSAIADSRALARLLLADVRDAVSTLRDEGSLDIRRALALIAENVPQLDVQLSIADDVRVDDVEVAEAIVRCVQEAITNTLRHSGAATSWVDVAKREGVLQIRVTDDGKSPPSLAEGNGLTGMRERIERIGGTLERRRVNEALSLTVDIPLAAA